jgi:hypothetical protein
MCTTYLRASTAKFRLISHLGPNNFTMSSLIVVVLFWLFAIQAVALNHTDSSITYRKLPRQTLAPSVMSSLDISRSAQVLKTASSTIRAATSSPAIPSQFASVPAESVQKARALVAKAHEPQAAYNSYQADNPRRNTWRSKKSSEAQAARAKRSEDAVAQPVFSQEVKDAIKLLGYVDARTRAAHGSLQKTPSPHRTNSYTNYKSTGKIHSRNMLEARTNNDYFWMPNMDHLGTQPCGGNSSYPVRFLNAFLIMQC